MGREIQLSLLPGRGLTAKERRALIRQRLHGFEVRQRARAERRRLAQARRKTGAPIGEPRQMTLEDLLDR